jgi:hypothetical protein
VTKRTHILATAGCALALLVAGCGSDEEGKQLPEGSVAALQRQLDSIQDRVDADACRDVTDGDDPNTRVVQSQIDNLPSDVDKDVRDALQESFDNLFQLVKDQCEPAQTETETTETVTPPPETTETQTTPPETTTTETTTTPGPPGQDKKDKNKDKGGGEGSGGTQAEGEGD